MWVALLSGAISGMALFALQHLTIHPLIESAEVYEARAEQSPTEESADSTDEHAWEPAEGWQRTSLTLLSTLLTGIGFAALLFGLASMWGAPRSSAPMSRAPMTAARGLRWGLAGFACFVLAPSLGLPPEPPGVLVSDLQARQLWWLATVAATAGGLLLLSESGSQTKLRWPLRAAGVIAIALPHLIGAPQDALGQLVPDDLIRRFQIASIASNAVFWALLGTLGGYLTSRWNKLTAR